MNYALRVLAIIVATAGLFAAASARSNLPTSGLQNLTPETAFASRSKYTNAFFGFSLPLPQQPSLEETDLSSTADKSLHYLLALRALEFSDRVYRIKPKLSIFMVTAKESKSATEEDAHNAAAGPTGRTVKELEIGGKKFWKSEFQKKEPEGKMWDVTFAAALNDYILQFQIESFDENLTKKLERCVEAVSFFEPSKAAEVAGPESHPYRPHGYRDVPIVPTDIRIGQLNPGAISENVYTNDALGFTYQFPAGWVVNDEATQNKIVEAGHRAAWGDSPSAARDHAAFQQCGRILLLATKYPAGTKTKEYNPLVTVTAIDPACVPGLHFPTSMDDRDAMKETAQQLFGSFAIPSSISKGNNTFGSLMIQGHLMLDVTGSFHVNPPGSDKPLEIYFSMDFTQLNGYFVGWSFATGSQSELRELKNTKIGFASK